MDEPSGSEGLTPALARSLIPSGVLDAVGDWRAVNDALAGVLGPARPALDALLEEPGLALPAVLAHLEDGARLHVVLPDGVPGEAVITPDGPDRFLVQLVDRREVQRLQELAEEAITAFEAFVSRVSHDLRNPIGTALGFAELLQADPTLSDESQGFADRIRTSALRASELLAELVTEARTTARIDPPDDVDVGEVVEQVRRELAELLSARSATVRADRLPQLRSDARTVHRALAATVRNAVEHHPGAATVRISARPAARGWELLVDDDGPGLSAEDREAVLAPGRTAGTSEGAGLGLSLARAAVERRGGSLRLDANEDGGVRVRILLPQRRASDPEVGAR